MERDMLIREVEYLQDETGISDSDILDRGLSRHYLTSVDHEGTVTTKGESPLAVQSAIKWDAAKDRPADWIGEVYGLVVHTTGGSLPGKAIELGKNPTLQAVQHYTRNYKLKSFHGGCHYVNGWSGMQGGELVQVANERERAYGVGLEDQNASINNGKFEKDLPAQLVKHWKDRWPNYANPKALLPKGTKSANSSYINVECVPVVYYLKGKTTISQKQPPMYKGLRFTKAQHDTIAYLACDIAIRNGWPLNQEWWRTPRLLGHEDLSPITRKDKIGGWDPGYLRDVPYFDFDYVYKKIAEIKNTGYKLPLSSASKPSYSVGKVDLGLKVDTVDSGLSIDQLTFLLKGAVSKGEVDDNKLTNLLFYAKYPSLNGQKLVSGDPLAKEWLRIRDTIVKPFLKVNQVSTNGRGSSSSLIPPLGKLQVNTAVPALSRSTPTYQFTSDDALWLARFVVGEAGGRDNLENHAVVWTMFNKYGAFRNLHPGWGSFGGFIRRYSTTLQDILNNVKAAKRVWKRFNANPTKNKVVLGVGFYPGTQILKVQSLRHRMLQQKPWRGFSSEIQNLVVKILSGKIQNPGIGIATEFDSTYMFFEQKYNRKPSDDEWKVFTKKHAKNKNLIWVGDNPLIEQKENAFFIDHRLKDVPPNSIKIV